MNKKFRCCYIDVHKNLLKPKSEAIYGSLKHTWQLWSHCWCCWSWWWSLRKRLFKAI